MEEGGKNVENVRGDKRKEEKIRKEKKEKEKEKGR